MGIVEFFIIVIVVAVLASLTVWILGQIPSTPAILPRIVWIVAVLVVLYVLLAATGILGHDIRIPHV